MGWLASLASGVGSAVSSGASGLASGVGKVASGFHKGVGQGSGLWGGQAGTQGGGAMIKNPMSGGVTSAPQTGWGAVANKLGQFAGQYTKSQSPISFSPKKSTPSGGKKTALEMLDELAGRK